MTHLTRRRALTIAAAFLAISSPGRATPRQTWTGRAFGADARITLSGASPQETRAAFRAVEQILRQTENRWSLHSESDLARLNRLGHLAYPSAAMLALFATATDIHAATQGGFDPSVQPLWQAIATNTDTSAARALIGWHRVQITPEAIHLDPGMALTFNGIAQGAAADAVIAELSARGFQNLLVDVGEQSALGTRPDGTAWQAAIALPNGDRVARTALQNTALATSSPTGTLIGAQNVSHILNPHTGQPTTQWRLASVSHPSAAVADALSTAFCTMPQSAIDLALSACPQARLVALI